MLGLRFDPYVLARIMDAPVETVLPALRWARDANIVEEDGERVRFRFRHALTRQAVYDDLLLFDARRTHQAILVTLEALDAENEHVEGLAYHAWEARDLPKARRDSDLAGERAFTLFALPEARICFERALQAATDRQDEARLTDRLGRVTSLLGSLPKAIELYKAAIAAFIKREDFGHAAFIVARARPIVTTSATRARSHSAWPFSNATVAAYRLRSAILIAMLARLAVNSRDIETAVELLARIEAPDAFSIPARQTMPLAQSEIAWYTGDTSGWSDVATQIVDTLPSITPFIQLVTGYTIAHGASYYMRDDLVNRIFALIDRTEARAEIDILRSCGVAVRALNHFARGHLNRARDAVTQTIDLPALHVSDTVLASTTRTIRLIARTQRRSSLLSRGVPAMTHVRSNSEREPQSHTA